ncbi:hypothetical protein [Flavobacterium sp. AJR]|uniref:hypothetical protein n=1 Tax=Flavobacterium sp. AJR TaxID=1979369 RepID=UPI000A3D6F3D|nr:hypothetical protein [Flavobacterium sp. AJR]OUL61376.1 hypothetical protein B8T70_15560 [Flavobacterium sp. AJR]
MVKRMFTLVLLLFFAFSCNSDDALESTVSSDQESNIAEHHVSTRKSSSLQYSLFQNVEQYNLTDAAYAQGEIYCSEAAVAVIEFGYQGSPASKYEIRMPGSPTITAASGKSFRTLTVNLNPGINTFSVWVLFSGPAQSANLRLNLVSIGGDVTLNAEGYIDLVTQGHTEPRAVGGAATPYHLMCSKCGALNSAGAQKCISCGK